MIVFRLFFQILELLERPRLYKTDYSLLWVTVIFIVATDLALVLIVPYFSNSAAQGVLSGVSAERIKVNFDYLYFGMVGSLGYIVAVFETWRNNRGLGDFVMYFVVFNICFISLTWVVQYLIGINIGLIKGLF